MTEEDWEESEAAYERHLLEEEQNQLSEHQSLINAFKDISKQKGLVLNGEDFRYIERIGIVACFPGILNILNPEIRKDKEGLVSFKVLDQYLVRREQSDGLLYDDDHVVMAHPLFQARLL